MNERFLIWILEDDPGAQFVYSEILSIRYDLRFFSTLGEFRAALSEKTKRPRLIIADLRLPDGSFLSFLAEESLSLTAQFSFIVVSSSDDTEILKSCFDQGASDYLTKPFNRSELNVKVQRIIQRTQLDSSMHLRMEHLKIKGQNGNEVQLTPKELQILSILKNNSTKVTSRHEIIRQVWGAVHVSSKALDVHIFNLRKKIAPLGIEIRFMPPDSFQLHAMG